MKKNATLSEQFKNLIKKW